MSLREEEPVDIEFEPKEEKQQEEEVKFEQQIVEEKEIKRTGSIGFMPAYKEEDE